MIDVKTAQELVLKHSGKPIKTLELSVPDALDYVLAKDVISPIAMPPFRQSAMDGYALRIGKSETYTLVGEVKAGDNANPKLAEGEAVRIFTGAPVPDTANAVMMQEKVNVLGKNIIINETIAQGLNIRPKGEQIKEGTLALAKGTAIKGAHIGFLTSLGIVKITVCKKPTIAIVVTGNELVKAGNKLAFGEVYESNGEMLRAVLNELGYKNAALLTVKDNYEHTKKILQKTIESYDVVLVTGGVSVGDYDFVGTALKAIGINEIFYKVKQKPGKPLYFGKKDEVSIFGLPGNPAAALTCFYIYVYSYLKATEGVNVPQLTSIKMPLFEDYKPFGDRAQFLKARLTYDSVEILTGQSSAMVRSFSDANALVFLPENTSFVEKGTTVKTILLPIK